MTRGLPLSILAALAVLASCQTDSQRTATTDASASGGSGGIAVSTGGIRGTGGISATGGNTGTGLGPELCGLSASCDGGVVSVDRYGYQCNPAFSFPCDHGCNPDAAGLAEGSAFDSTDVSGYVDRRLCLGSDDAGVGGIGGTAGAPGKGGAGGATLDTVEYRACELVTDVERIDLFRIDRASGTCTEVSLLQTSSTCPYGISNGGWCVSQAHVHTDLTACENLQHAISSSSANANASAATGTFAVSRVAGKMTVTMDLSLSFPATSGLPGTVHAAAADCWAGCKKTDCRP